MTMSVLFAFTPPKLFILLSLSPPSHLQLHGINIFKVLILLRRVDSPGIRIYLLPRVEIHSLGEGLLRE